MNQNTQGDVQICISVLLKREKTLVLKHGKRCGSQHERDTSDKERKRQRKGERERERESSFQTKYFAKRLGKQKIN